ncbi:MAG TPA: hypothetical protein VHA30_03070 [Patescibacteria group bacterium]|nr:hypothetical protein [Patescibacteria group bacterium]
MTDAAGFNFQDFDREWTLLGKDICQAVYTNPEVQKLKYALQKNGFLTLEEKSQFINICDKTKYEVIYSRYGQENSDSYKRFSDSWKSWFQAKGVESQKNRGQRSSVDHILFGSTPDPVPFLLHFEEEILGSLKK